MATLANALHPRKALIPILVTDAGMSTLDNELHPRKANVPMLSKDVGIVTLVIWSCPLPTLPTSHVLPRYTDLVE